MESDRPKRIWFSRCNGETSHNNPNTRLYVAGEPPAYSQRAFEYKHECIVGGFARIGYPGTGDLRNSSWHKTVYDVYPDIRADQIEYLRQFASIAVGDLMLIPAYREKGDVRIGTVIDPPTQHSASFDGVHPYYYFFNVRTGDWYENAHRVPVRWAERFVTLSCLGRVWPKAFGEVQLGASEVIAAAQARGLLAA